MLEAVPHILCNDPTARIRIYTMAYTVLYTTKQYKESQYRYHTLCISLCIVVDEHSVLLPKLR